MLILLPPSEGKTSPLTGPALDLASLSFPTLTRTRRQVLGSLVRLCRGKVQEASTVLGLGPTQQPEVIANRTLRRHPSAPAISVYSGVLYEALDHASLSAGARKRLDRQVAIASALWGLVRPSDVIPPYRLSGGVALPDLGPLSAVWRAPVTAAIESTDGLIVDLRSSSYVGLGPVPRSAADRAATVRVLQDRDGKRSVVSHSNKATKGRIARSLVTSAHDPGSVDDLLDALSEAGFRVEPQPSKGGRPSVIDVIVDQP